MLLVVDIGNSNIVLGLMSSAKDIKFAGRVKTFRTYTADELTKRFAESVKENHAPIKKADSAIIASVVPEITNIAAEAVEKLIGCKPMILDAELETGLKIEMDDPGKVGADLIAASAGAVKEYEGAVAIFDLGTATTLSVIDSEKKYIGTIIMPGVYISLKAMTKRASQLHAFALEHPEHMLGKNTTESMQSGVLYGNAAMLDGLAQRVEKELGCKVTFLITGGIGRMIQPYCCHKMICERDLVLKGLWYIYNMNVKGDSDADKKRAV